MNTKMNEQQLSLNLHTHVEEQLELPFDPPLTANYLLRMGSAVCLLNACSSPSITMTCHKTGKTATLDFSNGHLVFKGEVEGAAITFLNFIHQYVNTRAADLYKDLCTYKGSKNCFGEYLADEEYNRGLFPNE
jgi:hypothetical protein